MPTGYTAELCNGDVSFEKFVMTCARAFLVETREEPFEKPIPAVAVPDNHHADALEEARKKLSRLKEMRPDETEREADKEFRKDAQNHENRKRGVAAIRDRLVTMRSKVSDWQPPTKGHEKLAKFMLEQINITIKHDGDDSYLSEPRRKTGAEWLTRQIESVEEDITYHTREYAEDVKRAKERDDWVRELRASL